MAESSEKTAMSSGPTVTEITDQNEACLVSEEDKKVQDILANPELREILVDPQIQSLFEMLRTRPEEASRYFLLFLFVSSVYNVFKKWWFYNQGWDQYLLTVSVNPFWLGFSCHNQCSTTGMSEGVLFSEKVQQNDSLY